MNRCKFSADVHGASKADVFEKVCMFGNGHIVRSYFMVRHTEVFVSCDGEADSMNDCPLWNKL